MTRIYQAIKAHTDGSIRTGNLFGKEYVIVPVVALVEGVIQGMTANGPELALASEFGKFPDTWNGRPIVVNHPVIDGNPISANSPEVLESWSIGTIFNSKLNNNQLILEAWIDVERAKSLNESSLEILNELNANNKIEVSTGYFAEIEQTSGMYNNSKYDAIQRNIVPDHLAFLSIGTVGACSIEDGCGASFSANMCFNSFRVEQPSCGSCCESCKEGKPCEAIMLERNEKGNPKTYKEYSKDIINNAFPLDMLSSDVIMIVSDALKVLNGYSYVVGITQDKVVYDQYNSITGYYETYQRSFDVSSEGQVTLGNDIEKVNLVTKILTANAEDPSAETTETTMDNDNTVENENPDITNPVVETLASKTQSIVNDQGTLEVKFNEKGEATEFQFVPKVQSKKPSTVDEFIAQAPKAIQEVLQAGLKMHEDQKTGIIAQLKASNRCKFSDAELKSMPLAHLQSLAELANLPDYSGRAAPINNQEDAEAIEAAPLVFSRNAA